jgi:hypothetical protein
MTGLGIETIPEELVFMALLINTTHPQAQTRFVWRCGVLEKRARVTVSGV